MGGREGK